MLRNMKNPSDGTFRMSILDKSSYRLYLFCIKLCQMNIFAFRLPSLFSHIIRIVFIVPTKQVFWVYTRRIIAFVQNTKPLNWDFIVKGKRKPMGQNSFTNHRDITIAISIFNASPNPALTKTGHVIWDGTVFINIIPESLFRSFGSLIKRIELLFSVCKCFFSSLHKSFYVELLAVSGAQYIGDGDLISHIKQENATNYV
jgi:hypothetical protein